MRTNIVIPSEATHSSLDLFEKPPLLVTFDQSFEQKTGPLYSPSGSSLEFEVVGDRNNFTDLQKNLPGDQVSNTSNRWNGFALHSW